MVLQSPVSVKSFASFIVFTDGVAVRSETSNRRINASSASTRGRVLGRQEKLNDKFSNDLIEWQRDQMPCLTLR